MFKFFRNSKQQTANSLGFPNLFRSFSYLSLLILTAILFWYCKKDEVLTENESSLTTADYSKTPVTLAEVKKLYGEVKQNPNGTAASRAGEITPPFDLAPCMKYAYEAEGAVVAPVYQNAIASEKDFAPLLKFYKNAQGEVRSSLYLFLGDSLHYVGKPFMDFKKFYGSLTIINDENIITDYVKFEDGNIIAQKRLNIPYDQEFVDRINGIVSATPRCKIVHCNENWGGNHSTPRSRRTVKKIDGKLSDDEAFPVFTTTFGSSSVFTASFYLYINFLMGLGQGGQSTDPNYYSAVEDFCKYLDGQSPVVANIDDSHFKGGNPSFYAVNNAQSQHLVKLLSLKNQHNFSCGDIYTLNQFGLDFTECAYKHFLANGNSGISSGSLLSYAGGDPARQQWVKENGCALMNSNCGADLDACIKNMRIQELKDKYPEYQNEINSLLLEGHTLSNIENWLDYMKNTTNPNYGPPMDGNHPLCANGFVIKKDTKTLGQLNLGMRGFDVSFSPALPGIIRFDALLFSVDSTANSINTCGGRTLAGMVAKAVNDAWTTTQAQLTINPNMTPTEVKAFMFEQINTQFKSELSNCGADASPIPGFVIRQNADWQYQFEQVRGAKMIQPRTAPFCGK